MVTTKAPLGPQIQQEMHLTTSNAKHQTSNIKHKHMKQRKYGDRDVQIIEAAESQVRTGWSHWVQEPP